jgi:REP element-mobilizing transposase RayT
MDVLAYHIVWTTYGTWLPGDARGWVQSGKWGIQPPDLEREQQARAMMAGEMVVLSQEQRDAVEQAIRENCRIRGWTLHAVNVRSNHIHVVVTSDRDGDATRDQLKSSASRCLSDLAGLTVPVARKAGRKRWWTEGGDAEKICDERYLENAIRYVLELQGD